MEADDEYTLAKARADHPHLNRYCAAQKRQDIRFVERLTDANASKTGLLNLIYPVGDPIFVHIFQEEMKARPSYRIIEPYIEGIDQKYGPLLLKLLEYATTEEPFNDEDKEEELKKFNKTVNKLLEKVSYHTDTKDSFEVKEPNGTSFFSKLRKQNGKIPLTSDELRTIKYRIQRDILDHGPLEGLIRDPYIEDIHAVGLDKVHIIHKVFEMLETNVQFANFQELERFLRNISERIGHPVSDTRPIVDAALPGGSRINIVYSTDVSKKGPSFTIRKFTKKPPPIPQLIQWGTIDPTIAAYLWLCLENGMSIFISGETASGKTTTLNAMLAFINHKSKIFSAEDTPEVVVAHPVWQQLITRETGADGSRVELFDLVRAALRSRPDYIIVGEIRGKEGSAAFQAIQTGHAVLTTFHASSITRMIQRFTGDPINVPIRFMDNLNIALFQELLYKEGRTVRRCSSIQEIIRYSKEKDGVLTREIFSWDPTRDEHIFVGRYNSFILEEKIGAKLGHKDRKQIYDELDRRRRIIQCMVEQKLFNYDTMNEIMRNYYEKGIQGLPASLLK